ncbi:MAG: hypothetical protein V9G20_30625 [Candidatus Promineifilaceae bacterium]
MNYPGTQAKALHAKFPDKPILIAGDDDQDLEATQGINPGRSKAEEAAKVVGGGSLLGDCLRQTPAARLPPTARSLARTRWLTMTTQFAMCAGFHGHSAMVLLTKRKKSVP